MALVSVIMPTYNRGSKIRESIISILNQSYKKIEVIVIDDGSTDKTKEVIDSIGRKEVKYFFQDNSGACVARNKGMELASGKYIMFMDSDDLLHKDKIKVQVNAIKKDKTPFAICDFEYVDKNNQVLKKQKNSGSIHDKVINFESPFIMTSLIKKDSIPSTLRWNKNILRNQDMDFFFKYFIINKSWSYTPGYYCQYVQHGEGQISDTYHLGIQIDELKKSMIDFFNLHKKLVPIKNLSIVDKYLKKLDGVQKSKLTLPISALIEQLSDMLYSDLKLAIYGNGSIGKSIKKLFLEKIVCTVDIADKNNHPQKLNSIVFDKVIVTAIGREKEIVEYLKSDLSIPESKIVTLNLK